MRLRGKRAIALVPIALTILLGSCGGDSSKETGRASVATAPGSTTPSSGASGGARHGAGSGSKKASRKKKRGRSGGSAGGAPGGSAGDVRQRRIEREKRRVKRKSAKVEEKAKKNSKQGNGSTPTTTTPAAPPAPPKPLAGPQQILFNKARRVCENLTLTGLAQKYDVAATPDAVASAFAASYPETFRKAVHDGCITAFSG